MSETFCGKSCELCPERETNSCQGCRVGPGNRMNGSCAIAKCCREKGHTDCSTCGFVSNCGTYRGKDTMIQDRERAAQREAEKRERIAAKAPILGKWLWLLFWLVVPNTIAGIMTNSTVVELFRVLEMPGTVLGTICSLISGVILLQLREVSPRYKTAAICILSSAVLDPILARFVTENGILILLGLAITGVGLYGQYQIFYGHSEAVQDVDEEMSDQWINLWTWYIGMFAAMFGCIFLTLLIPVLGLLGLIAVLIGTIVIGVKEFIYLYNMAKLFREYEA